VSIYGVHWVERDGRAHGPLHSEALVSWIAASNYQAVIGGIVYRNVASPVTVNGGPVLSLSQDDQSGHLGVSMVLAEQNGNLIATVENNQITLMRPAAYTLLKSSDRTALMQRSSGRLWLDLITRPHSPKHDLILSCIIFADGGYPILLHPDRSKFGRANDNEPPKMSGFTLTTEPGNSACAIRLENSPLYLLNVAIENFRTGIELTLNVKPGKS